MDITNNHIIEVEISLFLDFVTILQIFCGIFLLEELILNQHLDKCLDFLNVLIHDYEHYTAETVEVAHILIVECIVDRRIIVLFVFKDRVRVLELINETNDGLDFHWGSETVPALIHFELVVQNGVHVFQNRILHFVFKLAPLRHDFEITKHSLENIADALLAIQTGFVQNRCEFQSNLVALVSFLPPANLNALKHLLKIRVVKEAHLYMILDAVLLFDFIEHLLNGVWLILRNQHDGVAPKRRILAIFTLCDVHDVILVHLRGEHLCLSDRDDHVVLWLLEHTLELVFDLGDQSGIVRQQDACRN